jgi:hypothetical protein
MDVRELPPGEHAPDNSDRVTINVLPSGKAGFSGIYQAGTVTAHTVQVDEFPTEADAYDAAIQWAEDRRIETLYVERPDA